MNESGHEENGDQSQSGFLAGIAGSGMADDEAAPTGLDLSTAKGKRRISMTNMVMVIILVVSAGSLWMMRKQGKGAGMTFQVTKIDYDIEKAAKNDRDQQRLLAELARTGLGVQVQAERISKNPFQLDTDTSTPAPVIDSEADRRRRAEQDRERREREMALRLAGLQLNGVLGGSVPLARIGGQTVRVGDTVSEMFVVLAIHADTRTVDLQMDGELFTLTMTEGVTRRPTPRR